ncbi:hypothetical protein HNV12_23510 [Methanococcoides sp. SA1]|uniref:hypothetical protein n=1 Tax=unclassified Lentimicrobium TaxID=2677434 RepID=UPI001555A02F|nr:MULTISPECIES: hypothetical protein [unclassified Lentimicrobium]NPD48123.1 hypothetical protein [Lentimicrobium sp. S6]NPD86938.1 hypothetical protein [Lentimicrobium sp. L6]NPE30866.1 hypothetical protein [Methanococcoides sp. SA1]
MKNIVLILAALLIGLSSCKKDEEESVVSMEEMLCREWQMEKYIVNDEDYDGIIELIWEFRTDGIINASVTSLTESYTDSSEWRWTNNQNDIEIKQFAKENIKHISLLGSGGIDDIWVVQRIILLTSTKLIVETDSGDNIIRIEFKGKS